MSTPFRGIPEQISGFVDKFRKFFTKPQHKHFKTLIAGLTINENKTLQEINDSLSKKDQSSFNRFVTKSKWDIDAVNTGRIDIVKESVPFGKHGMQVIDSTLTHKTGKHMEKANYHRSGTTKELEWGHCIVNSVYVDDAGNLIPIDARIYVREEDGDGETPFKTKRKIGLEEVDFAVAQCLPISIVSADADFYSAEVVKELKQRKLKYILGVSIANKVSMGRQKRISIDEYLQTLTDADFTLHVINGQGYFLHVAEVYIRGVGKERLLVSYKYGDEETIKTYVTNLMTEDDATLMNLLLQRWKIEEWHRDAKQHLGLEKYQVRKYRGIQVVVLAVLVAYTQLALSRAQDILRPLHRTLNTIGEGCRYFRLIAIRGSGWLKQKAADVDALKETLNRYVFVKNAKV